MHALPSTYEGSFIWDFEEKKKTEGFENVILDENYVYFTIKSYLGIILNTILRVLISISFIKGL